MNLPENYDPSKYKRPSVTTDVVLIVSNKDRQRKVLLIRRKNPPYKGYWALPGGFIDVKETLKQCAVRELAEETGVQLSEEDLKFLLIADNPKRDPRTRVISVVYLAEGQMADFAPSAADDAAEVGWFPINTLPPLAFDHSWILTEARRFLQL